MLRREWLQQCQLGPWGPLQLNIVLQLCTAAAALHLSVKTRGVSVSAMSLCFRSVGQLALALMLHCELMQLGALQHSFGQRLPRPAAAQATEAPLPLHHMLYYMGGQSPQVPAGAAARSRCGSIICDSRVIAHMHLFWSQPHAHMQQNIESPASDWRVQP